MTSRQLTVLCGDLLDRAAFEEVRAAGPTHHFVPNEPITIFELLSRLGQAIRPDLRIVETSARDSGRELISSTGALEGIFSGVRGWDAAIAEGVK